MTTSPRSLPSAGRAVWPSPQPIRWLILAALTVSLLPPGVTAQAATTAPATAPGAAPAAGAASPAAVTTEPWALLDELRQHLVADGALLADFTQDFLPAGFTSGERETGRLALALPACLRWDYEIPYAKSFLLCGELLYFWNQGESSGRRMRVDPENEPGLDLLLLSVTELRQRYRASAVAGAAGGTEVVLAPVGDVGVIAAASLEIDPTARRVLALGWTDREGNRTRFSFSGFRTLAEKNRFTPPVELTWEDEGAP